jgi:hypothetical protein
VIQSLVCVSQLLAVGVQRFTRDAPLVRHFAQLAFQAGHAGAQAGQRRLVVGQAALQESKRSRALDRPLLQHAGVHALGGILHRLAVRTHA